MTDRKDPNAFAAALTGVYATDPDYGAKLIGLMRLYNLYRYDTAAPAPRHHLAAPPPRHHLAARGGATIPGVPHAAPAPPARTPQPARTPPARPAPPEPAPAPVPAATPGPGGQPDAYRPRSKA